MSKKVVAIVSARTQNGKEPMTIFMRFAVIIVLAVPELRHIRHSCIAIVTVPAGLVRLRLCRRLW